MRLWGAVMKFVVLEDRWLNTRCQPQPSYTSILCFLLLMKNKFFKKKKKKKEGQGKLSWNCHVLIGGELIIMHLWQPAFSPLPAKDHCLNHHPSHVETSVLLYQLVLALISSHRKFIHSFSMLLYWLGLFSWISWSHSAVCRLIIAY